MLSTIHRNCHHLRHINFLRLHIQIQRTGMGLHAPNFQQTCPSHDINVNKISEYKLNV